MAEKKSRITSKSFGSNNVALKPSTVTRAAITAEIRPTRGKQLVEHNPIALIPDPNNPRPGDQIDDVWLRQHLLISTERSLCYLNPETNEYIIPTLESLSLTLSKEAREEYDFLRSLAFSIRNDGLIEPIEIFLADRNNDPEYFVNSELEYGYVVLEGHKRRLAGIMAGVNTVTCIEITDETMLARLKVRHRKLRRQLSENNLRKGLSVGQNFKIVRELLQSDDDSAAISVKELSSIIGLNEDIAGALKRLVFSNHLPPAMLKLVEESEVSFKWIRTWVGKPFVEIDKEIKRLTSNQVIDTENSIPTAVKARGRNGGAVKRSATFKVSNERDSKLLHDFLCDRIPELDLEKFSDFTFSDLERTLMKLLDIVKRPTRVGTDVTN